MYRHIIEKTDNKQINALHYALALTENEIHNRPIEADGLRNILESIESAKALTETATKKHVNGIEPYGFRTSPQDIVERMNKESQSTIDTLNTMLKGCDNIIEKSKSNRDIILNKLYDLGYPILDCVTEIEIGQNDVRQAFINLDNEFELEEFSHYLENLLTKHFGEGKFAMVAQHEFEDEETVPMHNIGELYSIAYSERDIGKLQGFFDDFTDMAIEKRKEAFIVRYEAMNDKDKESFLTIHSNYDDEHIKGCSASQRLEICHEVARNESKAISFMVGDSFCNMLSDFVESRDINKIINDGYRKPFISIPHGYRVNDMDSFRDIQGSNFFHSSAERRNGELALSSSFFIKENPELQQSADLVLSAISQEKKDDKSLHSERSL